MMEYLKANIMSLIVSILDKLPKMKNEPSKFELLLK